MGDLEGPCHSERGSAVTGPTGDVAAEQENLPGRRRENAGYHVEQRGLAGSVRADDGLPVSRHDREGHIMDGAQATEALGQPAQFKRGLNAARRLVVHARPPADRVGAALATPIVAALFAELAG